MEPLFEQVGATTWRPEQFARGPFDGLQGGAIAALMCAAAEGNLDDELEVVMVNAHFLRPTPLAEIEVTMRPIQMGGRVAVMQVDLAAAGKLRAMATITAVRSHSIEGLPQPATEAQQPWRGELRAGPDVHGKPWLMDKMEARSDAQGTPWFRFDLPVTGTESRFARSLCAADWIAGLTRADTWQDPIVAAAPNIDLTARRLRPPRDDWTGVRASGHWAPSGTGVAQGELLDLDGMFGTVSCTVALVPKRAPALEAMAIPA